MSDADKCNYKGKTKCLKNNCLWQETFSCENSGKTCVYTYNKSSRLPEIKPKKCCNPMVAIMYPGNEKCIPKPT